MIRRPSSGFKIPSRTPPPHLSEKPPDDPPPHTPHSAQSNDRICWKRELSDVILGAGLIALVVSVKFIFDPNPPVAIATGIAAAALIAIYFITALTNSKPQ